MSAKKLRACVIAFVFVALMPLSAAQAMPSGPRMASDSSFVAAVEDLGSSLMRLFFQVLAKAGVRADQNGGH